MSGKNNKILIVALMILTFCCCVQSQSKIIKTVIVNGDSIFCDSTLKTLSTERVLQDFRKIERLDNIWRSVHSRGPNTHPYGGEKIYAGSTHRGTVTYNQLNRYGIEQVSINDYDDYPFHIKFKTASPRSFNNEEYLEYNKTGKFPAEYCSFSEEKALERSRNFIDAFYGVGTTDRYDSLTVTHSWQKVYYIIYRVKIRNDICDYHSSHLEINPNNGELLFFNGGTRPMLSESDYQYKPVISKQQALQMYQDECALVKADVELNEIFLYKETRIIDKIPCWEWKIYGRRKDIERNMAMFMFIESETGKVIQKSIY